MVTVNDANPGELVEAEIDRVKTQFRESTSLLFLFRQYLLQTEQVAFSLRNLPSFFDINSAVGDQLTLIGKRLGWPRCHCICTVQPVFGFACDSGSAPSLSVVQRGNDNFTKVLLHMSGADTSTVFPDTNFGGSAHAWTANGNAQVSTASSKFGGGSLLCDGTGDYITSPDHADFELPNGDWTIDTVFEVDPGLADGVRSIMFGKHDAGISGATFSYYGERTSGNQINFALGHSAGTSINLTSIGSYTATLNPGRHHFAMVRSGTTMTMYIDGVFQGSRALAAAANNNTNKLSIGRGGETSGATWFGRVEEWRLSHTARWTANFVPPTVPYDLDTTVNNPPVVASAYPIVGFCESGTWINCGDFGVSEICIEDDEIYRGFLRARRYQMLTLYDLDSLTEALQWIWGPAATVLHAGVGRVVIAPGRELTDLELAMVKLVPRVLPIAQGIVTRVHFGALRVFGFGDGWGGFCEPYLPDGAAFFNDDTVLVTETGALLITGPITTGAPWMCETDVRPYSC